MAPLFKYFKGADGMGVDANQCIETEPTASQGPSTSVSVVDEFWSCLNADDIDWCNVLARLDQIRGVTRLCSVDDVLNDMHAMGPVDIDYLERPLQIPSVWCANNDDDDDDSGSSCSSAEHSSDDIQPPTSSICFCLVPLVA